MCREDFCVEGDLPQTIGAADYKYRSGKIRADTRGRVQEELPAVFAKTKEAASARRLLGILLFPPFMDTRNKTNDPVVTCYMIASLEGRVYKKDYNSGKALMAMLELIGCSYSIMPWNSSRHLARSVQIQWSDKIKAIVADERSRAGQLGGRVYFDSGYRIGRKSSSQETHYYKRLADEANAHVTIGHPSYKTLKLINSQSSIVHNSLWKSNLPALQNKICSLSDDIEEEYNDKRYTQDLQGRLPENKIVNYKAVQRTSRVYADGSSVLQLPRELRKIVHAGCHEIDLSSAQIAVACVVLPELLGQRLSTEHRNSLKEVAEMLRNGESFWSMLLTELAIDPQFKPVLKTAGCSTLFGSSRRSVQRALRLGLHPLGTTKCKCKKSGKPYMTKREAIVVGNRYASNRWVRGFDAACAAFMELVRLKGGAFDAFGDWISLENKEEAGKLSRNEMGHRRRSVLAALMQSYEQKIMQATVEEINIINKSRKEVHLIAWLHDSVTIKSAQRQEKYAMRIAEKLTQKAASMGIPTRGEINAL